MTELVLKLERPLKMDTRLTTKEFTIMVGTNGTGKSLILAVYWCCRYIINGAIISQIHKLPFDLTGFAQYVFDKSFSDQNFQGNIKMTCKNGECLDMMLEDGKVTYITVSGIEEIDTPTKAVFMSSNIRLFNNIQLYLKMRKMLGNVSPEMAVHKMTDSYKLYDVCYIENMIVKMPVKVTDKMKEWLVGYDVKENITEFHLDWEKCDFYGLTDDGTKKYMTSYGNGHQAIINMLLGTL